MKLIGLDCGPTRLPQRPLSADEERELVAALEKMTGKRVRLSVKRVPELLGGLVVRVGDTVYDGSVRHQLESLRTPQSQQEAEEHEEFAMTHSAQQ